MKRLLVVLSIGLLYSLSPLACFGQSGKQYLVVWKADGTKVSFDLEEEPSTKFSAGKLVISTSSMSAEYPLKSVVRFTYEGESTAISTPNPSGMGFSQKGDDIRVYGLGTDAAVQLYSLDGVMLESKKRDSDSTVNFSLSGRPSGVYVVKIGDHSLKFMKR